MLTVSVHSSGIHKAGAEWRIVAPLAALRRVRDLHVHVADNSGMKAHEIALADWVLIHNPHCAGAHKLVHDAKVLGCKVWVDWDDDLCHVPHHNPAYNHFSDPKMPQLMDEIAASSDVVSVSTERMADLWVEKARDVRVVPNALPLRMIPRFPVEAKKPGAVMWRGMHSHKLDCAEFASAMSQLRADEIHVLGYKPAVEWRDFDWYYHGSPGMYTFMATQRTLGCGVHVVPLVDERFNWAKSNIAAQEAFCAGSAVVAPDWDEWRIPGVVTYKTKKEFVEVANDLLSDPGRAAKLAEKGLEYLRDHHHLEKINNLREAILFHGRKT